jgi:hypothetical protein
MTELLGDLGHVESRLVLFADRAILDARLVHGLCRIYHRLGNDFGHTRWNCYVTWAMWKLVSIYFADSANFDTRLVHGFYGTYYRLENHF